MQSQLEERLDELVLFWEERRASGESVLAAELCRDCPELTEPLQEQIKKLERMEAVLGRGETVDLATTITRSRLGQSGGDATESQSVGETLETHSVFRIVRAHAKGGLGEVLLAEDQELRRPVALKRIQHPFDRDPERRQRFLREAEITSRLEHPGVVPVHSVGQDSEGRPCYTMRFVQGDTLHEAIQQFHAEDTAAHVHAEDTAAHDPGQRRLALRQLLTHFVAACNTVAYAHSQSILHRDLKPANIMLGPYGQTLVVDWGLAKQLDRRPTLPMSPLLLGEGGRRPGEGSEALDCPITIDSQSANVTPQSALLSKSNETWIPHSSPLPMGEGTGQGDSNLTQTGSAIGTPAFMSPEQAVGRTEELGPPSDIYSLGATLYVLLTGKMPFENLSLAVLLNRVQRGEFASPRSIRSSVAKPLDAICLKAMSRVPTQRYATALELAEEIEHWLADEPVRVYLEPILGRVSRFVRHHRAWAMSGAAALVLIAVIATVSAFWIDGQKQVIAKQGRAAVQSASRNATLANEKSTLAEQEKTAREKAELNANAALRQTKLAERHLYLAHMNLAQSAGENSSVDQTVRLLDLYRPLKLARNTSELQSSPQTEERDIRDDVRGFEWFYWDRWCHSELLTLHGHTDAVTSVAFSPNGKRLASSSFDETVKVWDTATGQESLTLKGHTGLIWNVAFSPDGQRLASASLDQTVKVWDADTGQALLTLQGHTAAVLSVAFSPDGMRLASGCEDGTIKLWDAATGQEMMTLKGHNLQVWSLAFSPDGKRLASASFDHTIKVWDAATGQESLTLKGHFGEVWSVAFNSDGTRLASASYDKTLKLWDAVSGRESLTLRGHTHPVHSVAFSPDGRRLVSAGNDQMVKVWDAATGVDLLTLSGHTSGINRVVFSPDGQRLVSASVDRTVKVWDATAGQESLSLKGHLAQVHSVAFSPDGTRLASASSDQTVRLWDVSLGQEVLTLKGHTAGIGSVAFSPDGKRLASSSGSRFDELPGCVILWDADTGQALLKLKGHTRGIASVAFSSDSQRLATASFDRTIKLWDAGSGQELLTLKGHTNEVWCVAFSPDGKRLASSSRDNTVRVWDTVTGQESLTLSGHTYTVTCVAFSPDGRRLASSSWDHTIKVWDAATGEESLTLKGYDDAVTSLCFISDGLRLASASYDPTVKVWDARPWTSELKIEQAALSVLRHLCARPVSEGALMQKIRENQTISDAVRERSLALAGTYWHQEGQSVNFPTYLTTKRKQRNLLQNGSFEDRADNSNWTATSWQKNPRIAVIQDSVAHEKTRSVLLATDAADDAYFAQEVTVQPNTDYLLCGWVKTEGVKFAEQGRNVGANLSVFGGYEHSQSVTGDSDWTYLAVKFNSGSRTKIQACARLGHHFSTCTGKAWFDDLCLIPLDDFRTNSHSPFSFGR